MRPRRAAPAAVAALAVLCACAPAHARGLAITAPEAIVIEPQTQDVVFARRATARRPIASTTKLMTALLTLERTSLHDVFSAAPYHPLAAESVMGLRTGERLTVADLLRGLLIVSANDAAVTLATRVAGSVPRFVAAMNRRARQLGLHDTHYANPVGLDQRGNYSSAADLVKLALVLRERRFFRRTTDLATTTLRSGSYRRHLVNRNLLVRTVPYVNGVKTGHTLAAGNVLVGSATRHGVTVLSAELGDATDARRTADSLALLNYGLRRYHVVHAVARGQVLANVGLRYRDERVALVAGRPVASVARRGERLRKQLVVPAELQGPLPAGARVGTVLVLRRGRTVARVPLVTQRAIAAAGLGRRVGYALGHGATRIVLPALALCSVCLVLLWRRTTRRRRRAQGHGLAS